MVENAAQSVYIQPEKNTTSKIKIILLISFILLMCLSIIAILFFIHPKQNTLNTITNQSPNSSKDPTQQINLSMHQYLTQWVNAPYIPSDTQSNLVKNNNTYSLMWRRISDIILGRLIFTLYSNNTFDAQLSIHSSKKIDVLNAQLANSISNIYFNLKSPVSWNCGENTTMELCTSLLKENNVPYELTVYKLQALQNDELIVLCSLSEQNPLYGTKYFCLENDEKQILK